jgi:hypothetical protein
LLQQTPWGWQLGAKTWRSLIFVMNCILLNAFFVDIVNVRIYTVWLT